MKILQNKIAFEKINWSFQNTKLNFVLDTKKHNRIIYAHRLKIINLIIFLKEIIFLQPTLYTNIIVMKVTNNKSGVMIKKLEKGMLNPGNIIP